MTKTSSPTPSLVIMAKSPQFGRVKTRLAKSIGEQEALRIYLKLLDITAAAIAHWRGSVTICSEGEDAAWHGTSLEKYSRERQVSGALGSRLESAVSSQWMRGASSVIVIGSDCPELTADHIEQIAGLLEEFPVVFGPAHDGGYWALGIANPTLTPVCCDDALPWSTPQLLLASCAAVATVGLPYGLGPRLWDIDDEASLERVRGTGISI
jgi:rSAM/selenodomain-associated transferase 1